MKLIKHGAYLCGVYLCLLGVFPVGGQLSIATGVHYDTCTSDGSLIVTGQEFTFPISVEYKGEKFSFGLATAYSKAAVDIGNYLQSDLANLTDTVLSASYTYAFPEHPTNLVMTVDVNLPTGKSQLTKKETLAELGANNDLFKVDDFGEGFNVGFSCGVMREFDQELIGLQGTYLFKGKFDPRSDLLNDDFAPGDQVLLYGLLEYQAASWLNLGTNVSYAYFFPDKIHGVEAFRQGNRLGIGGDVAIAYGEIEFSGNFQTIFSGRNVKIAENTLKDEISNSNSINLFGTTEFKYRLSEKVDLLLQGDVRYYSENDLKDEKTGLPYSGSRTRYALGPGVSYFLNDNLSCDGVVKFFTVKQDRESFLNHPVNFQGVNVDLGLKYTF